MYHYCTCPREDHFALSQEVGWAGLYNDTQETYNVNVYVGNPFVLLGGKPVTLRPGFWVATKKMTAEKNTYLFPPGHDYSPGKLVRFQILIDTLDCTADTYISSVPGAFLNVTNVLEQCKPLDIIAPQA